MSEEKLISKAGLWDWVKAICTVILTIMVAVKICLTTTTLSLDFPTLLSLLLALFSVGLSALFYFKATDTSNTFYDNTYKFTRDIAQLLAKMESGFGERLRNLDEGYSSMRGYIQGIPVKPNEDVENAKKNLEAEKLEVDKVVAERNDIIKQLVERSQLQEEEKASVLAQLNAKEKEVRQAQSEVEKLNKHLFMERLRRRKEAQSKFDLNDGMAIFTRSNVVPKIGNRLRVGGDSIVKRGFDRLINELPRGYLDDLEQHGFVEDGLTESGIDYLKAVAKSSAK